MTMDTFDNMFLTGVGHTLPSGDGSNMDFSDYAFDTNTVSPHDLHADSLIMSNPPSTAFPSLNTPDSSFIDSPTLASSGLNTSPLECLDSTLDFNDPMPSLFPEQFTTLSPDNAYSSASFASSTSQPQPDPSPAAKSTTASPMVRQKSSPGRPPAPYPAIVHTRKHSDAAGVHKVSASAASKSRKSLPEITIADDDDKETAKRKKNTAAARKSRQRKADMLEEMAAEIERLRSIITSLGADPDPPA